MTPLARRFAPHMALILGIAAIPVCLHTYGSYRSDDCEHPSAYIPYSKSGEAKQKRDSWMKAKYRAHQWQERTIESKETGRPVRTTIIRSYDAKRLYYRPEVLLSGFGHADSHELEWIGDGSQELPIHRARYDPTATSRTTPIVAYMLVDGVTPIADPYRSQLWSAPSRLFAGAQPMTLFFFAAVGPTDEVQRAEKSAHDWIRSAWHQYQTACSS